MEKRKLVRLRAAERAWTSTHLTGPNRYSQFWYRILPDGPNASHLEYRALHLEPSPKPPTAAQRDRLRRRLAKEDARAWRTLARALDRETSDVGR
ncbi:MAG TPA: hypothetical protein VGX00_06780 [Thermoplasmata archaeon]|nr:hypothetical protein [Thermoplasmata archaeon]